MVERGYGWLQRIICAKYNARIEIEMCAITSITNMHAKMYTISSRHVYNRIQMNKYILEYFAIV